MGPSTGSSAGDPSATPGPGSAPVDATQNPVDGSTVPPLPIEPVAGSEPGTEFDPVLDVVRRLTRDELIYTVRDVLGVSLSAQDAAELPVDRPLEGFVNVASGQSVSPDHVRGWSDVAERVVAQLDMPDLLERFNACQDGSPQCYGPFVRGLGEELFRRPLEQREREAFEALFAFALDEDASSVEAAAAVTTAMLQSPQFLYLMPPEGAPTGGANRTISGHEMASRLSYSLWSSAPDAELRAAAEDGRLDSVAGVSEQVQRMLGDPRTRRVTRRFTLDWGRLESLPDPDGLRADRVEAAVAFVDEVLWDARSSVADLWTAPVAYLTPELAEGLGLPSEGDGVRRYSLASTLGAVGLLGQPGLVAGMTNADGGEIVARGLFLLEQVFCGGPPDPPASLETLIEELLAELPETASQRDIAEARLERPQCAACHSSFDPLAYGLEQFDARGALRDRDEFGNELPTDGWIPAALSGGQDEPYQDLEGLASLLAQDERVRSCLTRKHLEYAMGARLSSGQTVAVEQVRRAAESGGANYSTLRRAMVEHALFRVVRTD